MTTIPLNGGHLRIRLVEAEVSKLKLDPENPRLHSAYLTHDLPAKPTQAQLSAALERLPEFQLLIDALIRNNGCFQPELVTADFRVLEGTTRFKVIVPVMPRGVEHESKRNCRGTKHKVIVPVMPRGVEHADSACHRPRVCEGEPYRVCV